MREREGAEPKRVFIVEDDNRRMNGVELDHIVSANTLPKFRDGIGRYRDRVDQSDGEPPALGQGLTIVRDIYIGCNAEIGETEVLEQLELLEPRPTGLIDDSEASFALHAPILAYGAIRGHCGAQLSRRTHSEPIPYSSVDDRMRNGGLTILKRRTKWIIRLAIGISIVLIGGVVFVLLLTSPNPDAELASIEIKELPDAWLQDVPEDPVDLEPSTEDPAPEAEVEPSLDDLGLPISGTLVMQGDERPFGEETFQIAIEENRVVLRANGKFWFKALIATITITFDQILMLDSDLRPLTLSSTFDAPLGFSRSMQAEFEDDRAIVQSGDDVSEYAVALDQAFVFGTFSTYAVIPLLYELRQSKGAVNFDVLVFGGPPNRDEETMDDGLPEMRVEKIEDGDIRFNDQVLTVSRYVLSGDMGTMTLYARGVELLGLFAGDDEKSLFVYRADYFEDGFEIVEAGS